jgi:hypothetical protein
MSNDDLPLFRWEPPRQVIPFPTRLRTGHARKVAEQLAQARTNREADSKLTRACQTLKRQMHAAGIPDDEIERQHQTFLQAISVECSRIRARWSPVLPEDQRHNPTPGGAA